MDLLRARWERGNFLCVGLDPDITKIPEAARKAGTRLTITSFNREIIDATAEVAGAFKPNSAFYESHGDQGLDALRETIHYIKDTYPEIPVILDAKRADIGNTNEEYARAAFDHLRADAITVNPYPGADALRPFLERKDKGVIVWCRTSNGGAAEFQDLKIDGEALYKVVARHVAQQWNVNGNCALVVGATYPEELREVRAIVGRMPLLVPGIGAQNGDLEKSAQAAKDGAGQGFLLNASRAIMYASSESDYVGAAAAKAQELTHAIRKAIQ